MANNLGVTTGADATIKTTDTAGVHTPHHNIEIAGAAPTRNAGAADANTLRVTIDSGQVDTSVAHGAADAGNPSKIGMRAIAHGTNPTAVDANDRSDLFCNRAGIPWVIGGHPNIKTISATIDDADGAQSDVALVAVSAGTIIVVTSLSVSMSAANTGNVAARVGFAATTLPAASEAGADKMLLEGKFSAGSGHQRGNGAGIIGIGADGEDLRFSVDDPVGGSAFITASYYTIAS